MTSPIEQARRYVAKIPPAVAGQSGHNQTFSVACVLVHGFALAESEALQVLTEYNGTCQPPWSERELVHKLKSAVSATPAKPRGHLLRTGGSAAPRFTPAPVKAAPVAKKVSYTLDAKAGLPEPLANGTSRLIEAVFQHGEGVRIVPARIDDEDGGEVPDGAGPCLSREEWLRKLAAKGGNPNKLWTQSDGGGIYIGINPLKLGGSKDADVTEYRHALIEFDAGITPGEQFQLYKAANLPCAAIIFSGGKSVHAWVKVEALDRQEYDERVRILYEHFKAAGFTLDEKNKNPSRLSRLPGCARFKQRQELLALNTGAESFTDWLAQVNGDDLGEVLRFEELMGLDADNDPNCIIGFRAGKTLRYLCKGKSAWLIAPSGQGKSSLGAEFAIAWAQGKDFGGIAPAFGRKLKSLIIQAENDKFDLAEMVQGIADGHNLTFDDKAMADVSERVVFKTETTSLGAEFCSRLRRFIDKLRPDVVWLDPMLSFMGLDVSKQSEVTQFLRQQLQPILEATGVVMIGIHHTGKVKSSKETANWTAIDYAYAGIGSSEFVNWARAVMYLHRLEYGKYQLMLAKRGKRSGARHPDGAPAYDSIFIKHADKGIKWEQIDPPEEAESDQKVKKKTKAERLIEIGCGPVIDALTEPLSLRKLCAALAEFAGKKRLVVSPTICREVVDVLVENGAIISTQNGFKKA